MRPQEAGMPSKDNHDTYSQGARPKETSGIQLTCVVLLLEKNPLVFGNMIYFFSVVSKN